VSFGRALLGSPLFASGERGRDGLASSSSLRDNPDPLGERCTKASWRALLSEPIHERPAPEVEMEVVEPEHHRQDMTDRCRGIPGAGLRPPGTSVQYGRRREAPQRWPTLRPRGRRRHPQLRPDPCPGQLAGRLRRHQHQALTGRSPMTTPLTALTGRAGRADPDPGTFGRPAARSCSRPCQSPVGGP